MRYTRLLVAALIMISLMACQYSKEESAKKDTTKKDTTYQVHKVTVEEVLNGKAYTYIRLSENGSEHWAAISKSGTKVGDVLYYNEALEMKNFESKELGRTFETILFISNISNEPISNSNKVASSEVMGKKPEISKADIKIEHAKGGITIAELYSNRDSYNGKIVVIKGKITKSNKEIMGKNWLHIQDGTSDNKNFDLTVTTKENLKVGDVVTLKGVITLSKDFGAGYFYKVIMEKASVVSSETM